MLLDAPPSPQTLLVRLGKALRRARKSRGWDNSDQFGKAIGVSGRTLRVLESSGKGSTESLVRVLLALDPQVLDRLLEDIENLEPVYSSIDEALTAGPAKMTKDKTPHSGGGTGNAG